MGTRPGLRRIAFRLCFGTSPRCSIAKSNILARTCEEITMAMQLQENKFHITGDSLSGPQTLLTCASVIVHREFASCALVRDGPNQEAIPG